MTIKDYIKAQIRAYEKFEEYQRANGRGNDPIYTPAHVIDILKDLIKDD